ncbi:cyclase family protein [Streptomonospora nanhaiensis]|uniref:cyclase family protein n=1 Tax=Streptomonospora nanhaiensis TaxID=1323731 RepID=UPI001C3826A1|nr:cyclase family protein [Streptomonospora nanhaiensis]MBV2365256.1 cyclase family protein [Streptomonospora nanhaiensis]
MRLIDLSTPIDAAAWEPDPVEHRVMSPAEGGEHMAKGIAEHFGLVFDPADLPDGELLSNDFLTLSAHTGTHVDAPAHYGTRAAYGAVPRTVDELPLEWFCAPAFVLDASGDGAGAVGAGHLRAELDRIGYTPAPGDIALVRTGADALAGTPAYFTDFTGLDGGAVHFLLDLGVRVIGTDAFSLDAPFPHMIETYLRTRDRAVLWPAHLAGREREYCQIERLANLAALPRPHGFTLTCFPTRIAGAGAGWTRAVAHIDEG